MKTNFKKIFNLYNTVELGRVFKVAWYWKSEGALGFEALDADDAFLGFEGPEYAVQFFD